jgi:hypothetical protein
MQAVNDVNGGEDQRHIYAHCNDKTKRAHIFDEMVHQESPKKKVNFRLHC